MEPERVLPLIEAAWRDVPYPGDDNLAAKQSSPCCSEYGWVATFFKGKHWRDVTLARLLDEYGGPVDAILGFMSPDAFRFYLPAFMVIGLREYRGNGAVAADGAVSILVPPRFDPKRYEGAKLPGMTDATNPCSRANVEGQRVWWDGLVSGFTHEQRRAIVMFLEYMHHVDPPNPYTESRPKSALEYWRRPGEPPRPQTGFGSP